LVFGIGRRGKGNDKHPVFEPTPREKAIVQRYLDDRLIVLMDAKAELLADDRIPEERRGPLGEWVRNYRALNPKPLGIEVSSGLPPVEGSFIRPGLGERQK